MSAIVLSSSKSRFLVLLAASALLLLAWAPRNSGAQSFEVSPDVVRPGLATEILALDQRNAELSQTLVLLGARISRIGAEQDAVGRLRARMAGALEDARETIAIGGLSQDLGRVLLEQRRLFPDRKRLARQLDALGREQATIGLQRLEHRIEQRRIDDPDTALRALSTTASTMPTPEQTERFHGLVQARQSLLRGIVEREDQALAQLATLTQATEALVSLRDDYDAFLDEHLLWARSAAPVGIASLGALPEQLARVLAPDGWRVAGKVLLYQARHSKTFLPALCMLGVLLAIRGRLIARIRQLGTRLGESITDRFEDSLHAGALTLLAAAIWPLLLGVTGWQMRISPEGNDFSHALAQALLVLAWQLFYLRALRMICLPDGLADAHFRWPEQNLRHLRAELDRLSWVFLPAALLMLVVYYLNPLYMGLEIGRVSFLILVASLVLALYRLFHPRRGVLRDFSAHHERVALRRSYLLAFIAVVALPLSLGILALMGYPYTAGMLLPLLLQTAWMIATLVVLRAFVLRWLRVARRRLTGEAAPDRRSTDAETRRESDTRSVEPETNKAHDQASDVDILALSDTSRKLLDDAILFAGVVLLLMIWSDVFPALRLLQDVVLWHHPSVVGGETRALPVTLADIGLALIYLLATLVLVKRLPALTEIILLRHTRLAAGSRYAATTLTSYAIVILGIVLVFDRIGADWSELQWLVAALGVGVGFGLQEIVANFVSGLIILFERPVRIGDVITVGDTDGTVTRIRIRATTIRNWDGKELLVPNKEFITGRLLNWSLSDQTTRILISLGIAYGANVPEAMRLLEETAREDANVLRDPAPSVIFESFGDNALILVLRCFVASVDLRVETISALNRSINDRFSKAGIQIAYPQRDLHLDAIGPLRIELCKPTDDRPRADQEPGHS